MLPQHTFDRTPQGFRYPPNPWEATGEAPIDWFSKALPEYLYSPDYIVNESLPYSPNDGPWQSGIYFLINDLNIIYVGKSVEILRRLNQHYEKGWDFERFWCFGGIPELFIEDVETFYIHAFEPELNEKYPIMASVTKDYVSRFQAGTLIFKNA